jgi:hypothetical protein
MEHFEFVVSWLAGNPRIATAWAVVILLALAWLLRAHRVSKARAQFKPHLRTREQRARLKIVDAAHGLKPPRRKRPPR